MKNIWKKYGWVLTTILGSFIFGAGYAIFLGPNDLNAGGISGLAAIIVQLVNPNGTIPLISVGTLTILINLPLFAIGGVKIGKRFFFGSLLGLGISSLAIDYLPIGIVLGEPLLAALYGAVGTGFGLGLVFMSGTSTGGSDIVVRLVKLKARNTNIGVIAMAFDVFVVALTGLVFKNIENALYTGITAFMCSKVIDMVVYGFDNTKTALIISKEHEKVAEAINKKLRRGATYLYSQGTYSGADGKVVLVAVYPRQVAELKEMVMHIDPKAFIIVQEAHQVLGENFATYSKESL
jgi:uncharacterized membrane-anchored protein YitT (DUF2179 family)